MIGIPEILHTKEDYLNSVVYAITAGQGKDVIKSRLEGLKQNTKINILKKSSEGKSSEDLTPDDFEPVDDLNCELNRLGFTEAEINSLIERLN